jgi:bifunctional ADP-heptose synthase (sugar kinase/adenylyltransferase)
VIERITAHCNETKTVTAVDPKKKNFLAYKNVTIFKPNLKEVKEGLNDSLETIDENSLSAIHQQLKSKLQHSVTFITLSEKGVFFNDEKTKAIIPSHLRNIADVSGAGDTVIAVASMVYTLTKDVKLMAALSNLAGGLVCEQVGVVPIDKALLLQEAISVLS